MTLVLPPGVKLGNSDSPVISTSDWPELNENKDDETDADQRREK